MVRPVSSPTATPSNGEANTSSEPAPTAAAPTAAPRADRTVRPASPPTAILPTAEAGESPEPAPTAAAPTAAPRADRTARPASSPTSTPSNGEANASSEPAPTVAAPTAVPKAGPTFTPVPIIPTSTAIPGAGYGGSLRLVTRERVAHLDVHQEVSPALATWGPGIVYSRLMRLRSGPGVALPSLEAECELCSRWWMEDDRTFVFELRDDVRWHNLAPVNGRPLDAGDVVYSFGRQSRAGWPNAPLMRNIASAEALDSSTLRLSLHAPDADVFLALADGHSKIVAREAVELNGDLMNGPTVGSGPWVFVDTGPDGSHSFSANPDYFETGLPLVDDLVIRVIDDRMTRFAGFSVGLIDVIDMEPSEWMRYVGRFPNAPSHLIAEPGVGLEIGLNPTSPPFDDVRVRRALLQALEPWRALEEVWQGMGFVGTGLPPVQASWQLDDGELRQYFGDRQAARRLLSDTGLDLPLPLSIRVGNYGETYVEYASSVAGNLEAVGFEPTLEVVNRRIFADLVWADGDYQMYVGAAPPITTPNGYLLSLIHSDGRLNTTGFGDGELDRLIEAQAGEYDSTTRRGLVLDIQRRLLDQAYRFMPAGRASTWTWGERVQNFHPNFAAFEYAHWARVWLADGP